MLISWGFHISNLVNLERIVVNTRLLVGLFGVKFGSNTLFDFSVRPGTMEIFSRHIIYDMLTADVRYLCTPRCRSESETKITLLNVHVELETIVIDIITNCRR